MRACVCVKNKTVTILNSTCPFSREPRNQKTRAILFDRCHTQRAPNQFLLGCLLSRAAVRFAASANDFIRFVLFSSISSVYLLTPPQHLLLNRPPLLLPLLMNVIDMMMILWRAKNGLRTFFGDAESRAREDGRTRKGRKNARVIVLCVIYL